MKRIGYVALSALIGLSAGAFVGCGGGGEVQQNVEKDKYEIRIACQSEEGEQEVMKKLIAAYTAKNPNVVIKLESFTGKDFEVFMNQVSQDENNSPHIIWTSDAYHARWEQYFTDLRPFYERSEKTDYSLYYESMLDTASINGQFKPTKNYKGDFRSDNLDDSDGLEDYKNHSEYGLYFAPRDYNKPTLLCNTALFDMLDKQYEEYNTELPADYVSTTDRLESIVAGNDWDDLTDLFDFAKMAAERIQSILATAEELGAKGQKVAQQWKNRTVLDLKLSWEPSYTTILNAMGVENIINADGTLNLGASSEVLETLHGYMYAENNLYYADEDDLNFKNGQTFMKVVSRPVVLSYRKNLVSMYKEDYDYETNGGSPLQAVRIPAEKIAGGCSGYAINSVYEGKGITVDGVYKSYADICWDFLEFIITEEGQEVAGATGTNIPVMKSLKDTGAWRSVEGLENMDHDAWLAGEELKQDWFNVYKSNRRITFRNTIQSFFMNFARENYTEGTLAELIKKTNESYNTAKPTENLR